jgi:methylated-DNA-[protein]-cysteine S-methyltransferase
VIRFWAQPTPIGRIHVVTTPHGIARIVFPGVGFVAPHEGSDEVHLSVAQQLDEYFEGARTVFETPPDLAAVRTDFARQVLTTLWRDVAHGTTLHYAQLAARVGRPRAARAVGNVMRANPVPIVVPCHRVLAHNGIGGYGGADRTDLKRALLAIEGVGVGSVAASRSRPSGAG